LAYEGWKMLRAFQALGTTIAEAGEGVVMQLGSAIEEIVKEIASSAVRVARAAGFTASAGLIILAAAAVFFGVWTVARAATEMEKSASGRRPSSGGACRSPFAQAVRADSQSDTSGSRTGTVDMDAVIAARRRMASLMDREAPAVRVERPRPAMLAVEDRSRQAARGPEAGPNVQDSGAVRSKLAILRMKASLIKAKGTESALSRPSSAKPSSRDMGVQTEPGSSLEGAAAELASCAGQPTSVRLGIAMQLLDGVGSQDAGVNLVRRAVGQVSVLAYTLDREDLVLALVGAKSRGLEVRIGCDRRFSLSGRCRDQEKSLRRLEAEGCEVRLLDGGPSGGFYKEVGRGQGGRGIAHAKLLVAEVAEGRLCVIGSCNFTTSSRANLESGLLVALSPFGAAEIDAVVNGRMAKGVALLPALRDKEISRSMTPRRARSQARSSRQAIPEEEEDARSGDF
jgi:hypothetical protein